MSLNQLISKNMRNSMNSVSSLDLGVISAHLLSHKVSDLFPITDCVFLGPFTGFKNYFQHVYPKAFIFDFEDFDLFDKIFDTYVESEDLIVYSNHTVMLPLSRKNSNAPDGSIPIKVIKHVFEYER